MSKLPSYPSMQACTASTGIPRGVLQQAKKEGCDAFDQANRVHLEPLLRWIFKNGEDGEENTNWPDRLKRAQALKAEKELGKLDETLVEKSLVKEESARIANKVFAVLTQKFETELPPKCDGMPAEDIAKQNSKALTEVRAIIHESQFYAE